MIRKKDRVSLFGNQEMFTKEVINQMKEMAMEKCILQMGQYIEEIGKEEYNVDKE